MKKNLLKTLILLLSPLPLWLWLKIVQTFPVFGEIVSNDLNKPTQPGETKEDELLLFVTFLPFLTLLYASKKRDWKNRYFFFNFCPALFLILFSGCYKNYKVVPLSQHFCFGIHRGQKGT